MLLNICEFGEKSAQGRRYLSDEHSSNDIYSCTVTPYGICKVKNSLANIVKVLISLLVN
jgi:hypothetical protein